MPIRFPSLAPALAVACFSLTGCGAGDVPPVQREALPPVLAERHADWRHYGGDEGGARFVSHAQITPDNVATLQPAWTYHTGDLAPETFPDAFNSPALQVTPILARNTLYLCSPRNRVIALDPVTGEERWHYDADPALVGLYSVTCRGVAFHESPAAPSGQACAARILAGTLDGRLLALDADSGQPCRDFGESGEIDLTADLGDVRPAEYALTSAPTVVGDRVVVGAHVADLRRGGVPSGVVRAFDVHSGKQVWDWEALPPEQRVEGSYLPGTPNAWAPFSADSERGLVFIPTGNPAGDYYGGERNGRDTFGSSVVALDALTGERRWSYQTVHHDIWDYDVPSQPVLIDYPGPEGPVPALVQATKMGFLFVLNRETGEPLLPIEERPAPRGGPAPEALSPTQPWPVLPDPLHPTELTEDDMFGFLCQTVSQPELCGTLHPHQHRTHAGLPGFHGRQQLGQRELGSAAQAVAGQYLAGARRHRIDSPRRGRSARLQRAGRAAAGHAVCGQAAAHAVAAWGALHPATLGGAHRHRHDHRPQSLGSAIGRHT